MKIPCALAWELFSACIFLYFFQKAKHAERRNVMEDLEEISMEWERLVTNATCDYVE